MNNEAFAALVDAHYAPLYRFALSLARNGTDAGDLVQQTFFIWATKGDRIRELSKAKSWPSFKWTLVSLNRAIRILGPCKSARIPTRLPVFLLSARTASALSR